jgi:hypothetical protein
MNIFNKTHYNSPVIVSRNLIPLTNSFSLKSTSFTSFYNIQLVNVVFFSTTSICLIDIPSNEQNSSSNSKEPSSNPEKSSLNSEELSVDE